MGLRGYCRLPSCNSRRLSSCLAADEGHAPGLANKWLRKKKLSERALTQRKARAREEPSPGPPASETDARPPGHQPRGGTPARLTAQPRPRGPDLESAQI